MSWNYRIIFHDLDPDPEKHWYGLHEVYYGDPEDKTKPGIGPTEDPVIFVCDRDEGKDGIIKSLELALKTLKDPKWGIVLTDSGMAQGIGAEPSKSDRNP